MDTELHRTINEACRKRFTEYVVEDKPNSWLSQLMQIYEVKNLMYKFKLKNKPMDCHNLEGLDVKPRTYNPEDKFYWNDFVETKLKHSFRTISTEYLLDYRVKNVPWKLTTLTGLQ
jgi:hypothetical protein